MRVICDILSIVHPKEGGKVKNRNYYTRFRFVDVTDIDPSSMDHIDDDREIFYAYSAEMIPWILEQ